MQDLEAIIDCLPEGTPGPLSSHTELSRLALDSLDFLQFLVDIERRFEISIPMEEAKQFKTIGDVREAVKRHHG